MTLSKYLSRRDGPTMIFLGAGAGVSDGLPSTDMLARLIRDDIDAGGVHPAFVKLDAFTSFLARGDPESLASLVSAAWQMRQQRHPVGLLLYHVVTEAVGRAVDLPESGAQGCRSQLLSHYYGRQSPLYVLTTNWDTSLDTIAQNVAGEGGVDYGLRFESDGSATAMSRWRSLNLYKLNGSPAWMLCEDCQDFRTDVPVLRSEDAETDLLIAAPKYYCERCKGLFFRVMVLPSLGAAYHPMSMDELPIDPERVPLRTLRLVSIHSEALKAVAEAQHLIFVGYSLPSYDQAIRELLKIGFARNHYILDGFAQITVVTKGPAGAAAKRNFEELLGPQVFRYIDQGLEYFLENMR